MEIVSSWQFQAGSDQKTFCKILQTIFPFMQAVIIKSFNPMNTEELVTSMWVPKVLNPAKGFIKALFLEQTFLSFALILFLE